MGRHRHLLRPRSSARLGREHLSGCGAVFQIGRLAEPVVDPIQHPGLRPASEVDVFVGVAIAPDDVARARSIDVDEARAALQRRGRRIGNRVPRGRPRHAVDVEPDVDRVETNRDDVVEAVAVDVVETKLVGVRADEERRLRHRDVAALRERAAGAVVQCARSPEPIAATGPILDVAFAQPNDVDEPVAVHVAEAHVVVAEPNGGSCPWDARRLRLVRDRRAERARPGRDAELAIAERMTPEREERLHLGPGAVDHVDEAVAVDVHDLGVEALLLEVDLRTLLRRRGDGSPLPRPRTILVLRSVDGVVLHERHVEQVDDAVAVEILSETLELSSEMIPALAPRTPCTAMSCAAEKRSLVPPLPLKKTA
ncbi:hypothetical protein BH09MYX1_BH09MYX1_43590 [soil metagenome]